MYVYVCVCEYIPYVCMGVRLKAMACICDMWKCQHTYSKCSLEQRTGSFSVTYTANSGFLLVRWHSLRLRSTSHLLCVFLACLCVFVAIWTAITLALLNFWTFQRGVFTLLYQPRLQRRPTLPPNLATAFTSIPLLNMYFTNFYLRPYWLLT